MSKRVYSSAAIGAESRIQLPGVQFHIKDQVKAEMARRGEVIRFQPGPDPHWYVSASTFTRNKDYLEPFLTPPTKLSKRVATSATELCGEVECCGTVQYVGPMSTWRCFRQPVRLMAHRRLRVRFAGTETRTIDTHVVFATERLMPGSQVVLATMRMFNGSLPEEVYLVTSITRPPPPAEVLPTGWDQLWNDEDVHPDHRSALRALQVEEVKRRVGDLSDVDLVDDTSGHEVERVTRFYNSYRYVSTTFGQGKSMAAREFSTDMTPINEETLEAITLEDVIRHPRQMMLFGATIEETRTLFDYMGIGGLRRQELTILLGFDKQFYDNGHTMITKAQLKSTLPSAYTDIMLSPHIREFMVPNHPGMYQLPCYHRLEHEVVSSLLGWSHQVTAWTSDVALQFQHGIETYDRFAPHQLTRDQRRAIDVTMGSPHDALSILVAPAGTGKTFVVDRIARASLHAKQTTLLLAISNKAVLRMSADMHDLMDRVQQGVSVEARTIASFLMSSSGQTDQPVSLIVVDEASMVGLRTWSMLLQRLASFPIPPRLLLVGDYRQLPPVRDAADPFRVLCTCGRFPLAAMTENHRSAGSELVQTLSRLAQYDSDVAAPPELEQSPFSERTLIRISPPPLSMSIDATFAQFEQVVPDWTERASTGHLVVLCSYKPRSIGGQPNIPMQWADRLRSGILRRAVPVPASSVGYFGDLKQFRFGDRVICAKNAATLGFANGRLGTITYIGYRPAEDKEPSLYTSISTGTSDKTEKEAGSEEEEKEEKKEEADRNPASPPPPLFLHLRWDSSRSESLFVFPTAACLEVFFNLAYIITVHKMQGSESQTIVLLYDKVNEWQKNHMMLYTALSRARERVLFVGSEEDWTHSVRRISDRQSRLPELFEVKRRGNEEDSESLLVRGVCDAVRAVETSAP